MQKAVYSNSVIKCCASALTGQADIQEDRKLAESSNQNGNQSVREVSGAK